MKIGFVSVMPLVSNHTLFFALLSCKQDVTLKDVICEKGIKSMTETLVFYTLIYIHCMRTWSLPQTLKWLIIALKPKEKKDSENRKINTSISVVIIIVNNVKNVNNSVDLE